MASYITLRVENRKGKPVVEALRVHADATVDALMGALYDEKDRRGKYDPNRQRLTLPPAAGQRSGKALEKGKSLAFYGLADGAVVQYKDLGVQVGYRTVFFLEYLGPLLIYPFFWSATGRREVHGISDRRAEPTLAVQDLALIYWSFHYMKRIYETFHVHKFSHATMPVANLFRNCAYYWLFAAFVSYFINHPRYTEPPLVQTVACLGLAYLCQFGNLLSHMHLASLRKSAGGYQIPKAGLFAYVTCANYTFEIWGWMLFAAATQSLPAAIFCACGGFQMVQWALAKHRRLRKLYDGQEGRPKYPRRWVIFPPLL